MMAFQAFNQQQQMQQMMNQQFYQQFYYQYLQFCQINNLNPNNYNSYNFFFQQKFGGNIPQPKPQPQIKHDNDNNDFYIHDDEKEVKPKSEKDLYIGNNININPQNINITFNLITRIDSIEITGDRRMMIPDLIQKLFDIIRVPYSNLKKFAFFYSGIRLDPSSQNNISSIFGGESEVNIIVIEESD